jgi:hypothetical protein
VTPTRLQRVIYGGGVISLLAYGLHKWSTRVQEKLDGEGAETPCSEMLN